MGVRVCHDMAEGIRDADVIIMLRLQNERMSGAMLPSAAEFFKTYGLTAEKLGLAKADAIVMHPGPINRGVEIDSAVADGRQSVILESARALNLAEGTTRFLLDPRDHIRAMREARERTMDVIGFYHSHPRSRAYPSETDVAESGYAGAMHLIAGEGESSQEMRLFVIDGANVEELRYQVIEDERGGGPLAGC